MKLSNEEMRKLDLLDEECPLCSECGCTGNETCGVEPVDKIYSCALDEFLVCPCCNKLGVKKNKERQRIGHA